MMTTGRVEAIRIARVAGAPMASVGRVAAHAGGGLEGDRYHKGNGEWSTSPGAGRGLTLVSSDTLDQANRDNPGLEIAAVDTRRNVEVRGMDLDNLVGREFTIGTLRCVGVRLAEPCTYLEGLVGRPIVRALSHKAGLRADILEDGEIAVGDPIVAGDRVEPAPAESPSGVTSHA
jgi:MOSC domain-containing protein YiiM